MTGTLREYVKDLWYLGVFYVDLVKFRMRDVEKSHTLGLISYEIYISENRTVCSIILVEKMQ
jgi:hypothetical protein